MINVPSFIKGEWNMCSQYIEALLAISLLEIVCILEIFKIVVLVYLGHVGFKFIRKLWKENE